MLKISKNYNNYTKYTIYVIITKLTHIESEVEKMTNEEKIGLLSKTHNLNEANIFVITYCYYTAEGKEALKAKRIFRQRIIQKAISDKWPKRSFLLEPDIGKAYAKWQENWAKDAEKHFITYFGKDPCLWSSKIREKFSADREQANTNGEF